MGLFAVAILGYSIQDREDTRQKGQLEVERIKLERARVEAARPLPAPFMVAGKTEQAAEPVDETPF